MAQRSNPDTEAQAPDTVREIHPVDMFPTWDSSPETGSHHVHRTVEDIYNENFRPGVTDDEAAEPQKPADTGGTAKA
jgi:hypothetical protein